jgi:hypothetical protein
VSGHQLAAAAAAISTPAERLRSMLVAAGSLTLHIPGHRADLVGRHRMTADRVRVELPADSCMARHIAHAGEVIAMIEVTDLAPVPARDRVRGRGTLTGSLTPTQPREDELGATLALAAAELTTADRAEPVEPAEFAAARPDPFATTEAGLLCHLNDHHPRTVEQLSRLIPADQLHGVRRIHPLRLDRHGLVLRLEFARRDRDVRLCFPTSVDDPCQLGTQIDALLARAARCRR